MANGLDTEVQFLKGVGPRYAKAYAKVGILTVEDVILHLPRRYQDRRNIPPIADARPGQYVTVKGHVRRIESRSVSGGRVILKVTLEDRSGAINLTWFNQPWVRKQLEESSGEIIAYGMVKSGQHLEEIASPEWESIGEDDGEEFAKIFPIYPLTDGLPQKVARNAAKVALEQWSNLIKDPLPDSFLKSQKLPGLQWALKQIHQPESEENQKLAHKRLAFEEFLYMQLELAIRRSQTQQELGIAFPIQRLLEGKQIEIPTGIEPGSHREKKTKGNSQPQDLFFEIESEKREGVPLWDQIREMMPFELTGAQKRVIGEVFDDMARPYPMNRLVQGDVGAGKTAVAAACMLAAVRSGYQCAMMAPTEILAEQHGKSVRKLLEPLGIRVELLIGKQGARERKSANAAVSNGSAQVAVGTHALIQEGVQFQNLGFVVIDEQHRFGVLQRKALRDKGVGNPDVLVMTATPIPRTLTMTLYGDLDLSVIDELPPGRKPIKTHWKKPFEREAVYRNLRELLSQGRQAYFVCPMVSESEKMMAQAAEELYTTLKHDVFSDFRVGLVHGQMKSIEKDEVMEQFRCQELDILVATTVIEVGVDVPNASIMVIEDANRFGLSQLHQLRGRVGRGQTQSYCILISDAKNDDAIRRLEVMTRTTDGFIISEEDLKIRGPGNMAGTEQSGQLDLKIADMVRDAALLEVARASAMRIISADPRLEGIEWSAVREKLKQKRSDAALITIS
jgi:ATP-dependent DNA helicase RecG